jgi:hypothetical protein
MRVWNLWDLRCGKIAQFLEPQGLILEKFKDILIQL